MVTKQTILRKLPAISLLLEQGEIKALSESVPRTLVADAAAEVVQNLRETIILRPDPEEVPLDLAAITDLVLRRIREKTNPSLRRVVNATGIVLHTNLGRAVLAVDAVRAIHEVAANYSNLELDLETGERGTRYGHVEELLCRLTGAEAGLVVNNNAGAVLLVLNTLARGKEVVVSRGQLVEIGGSFRIPDVMAQSGAVLVEVGTTNKTQLPDYQAAISEETAILLKVHTSNYRIIGFTAQVTAAELVDLGRRKGLPVVEDQGSGVLVDLARFGLAHEPTVRESLAAGVDVVTCSGDKLLGGPQAGIIVGKKELVARIKRNPLTRALRVDKFTLAALEATLRLYLDEEKALREIPALSMITVPADRLELKAKAFLEQLTASLGPAVSTEMIPGISQVGGGALPEENLPTWLVSLTPANLSVNTVEARLREAEPPVLARIQKEKLLFDPRTLLDGEEAIIIGHLEKIFGKEVSPDD